MQKKHQVHYLPKISVIMPVYNAEKFLPHCLDSILNQTFKDFEIICINDGSSDNSAGILEQYAEKDSRIKIFSQENQGQAVARNNGLKVASGEYIYFIDSDDFIHPRLLEYAYGIATKYNADLVNFDYTKLHVGDTEITYSALPDISTVDCLITDEPLKYFGRKGKYNISFNLWSKFYKRDLIKDFSFIEKNRYEDYPFIGTILSKKPHCVLTNLKLYYYIINPTSVTNQKVIPQQIVDYHEGINNIYKTYNKPEFTQELAYLKKYFMPNILKHQLNKCKNADEEFKTQVYEAFATELRDLNNKKLITWRWHKLSRYITYRILIARGK